MEKDEDGFFVVECPLLQGCYTQGKTLDEALKNIHEVIELCLEEQKEEIVALRSSTSCYDETNYGGCLGIYSVMESLGLGTETLNIEKAKINT